MTGSFCHPPKRSEGHLSFKNQKLFPSIELHCALSPPLPRCSPQEEPDVPNIVQGFPTSWGPVIPAMPSSRNVAPFILAWPGPVLPSKGLRKCHLSPQPSSPVPAPTNPSRTPPAPSTLLWTPFLVPCFTGSPAWPLELCTHGSSSRLCQATEAKAAPLATTPSSHTGHHSKILPIISLSSQWSLLRAAW